MEFTLTAVAAILTIIGYSMNDTVVVFDRLRENLRKYKRMPLREVIDLSINETLSRTIITGMTAIMALAALAVFGGEALFGFSVAHDVRHRRRHLFVDLRRRADHPAVGRQAATTSREPEADLETAVPALRRRGRARPSIDAYGDGGFRVSRRPARGLAADPQRRGPAPGRSRPRPT